MAIYSGNTEVGVYVGSEKIAGVEKGVALEPFEHTKRANTYTYLYFDCHDGATLHIIAGTLPANTEIDVRIGDNATFDDAGTNALTGLALGNLTSGEEKDFIVAGHRYASIQYIKTDGSSTARYAASGSCRISGAQAVKGQ